MVHSTLITTARIQSGLTQTELAHRAGTSQATLSKYESGEATPTLGTLHRLLAAAGTQLTLTATASTRRLDVRRGLMKKLHENRKEILEILHRNQAYNPQVFGSVARGEETELSDIDIMVDFDVSRRGLIALAHVADELQELIHQQIDLVPRSALAEHVHLHAQREAVPL
jgi:predicted nucleotidyltransferase/DNA-binding XRE family transcriptional regulator